MRRLVSTRRRVPTDRRDRYRAAWERLEAAVDAQRGHAWVFRAADGEPRYIEFLEFGADADPRTDVAVADALAALDRIAAHEAREEWIESWPVQPEPGERDG